MGKAESNHREGPRNVEKDTSAFSLYIDSETGNPLWRLEVESKIGSTIEVREMPQLHVAYVRHTGPYRGDPAVFGNWMPQSGYQPDDRLCYELYHHDPDQAVDGTHIVDICIPVRPL